MIDLVGHFGSHLSYATVAAQVAAGLRERDLLGSVTNLDESFIDDSLSARQRGPRGKSVLMIADAHEHLVDALVGEYGRDRVALFVCPNTNLLSEARARACGSVGRIYTPSRWCRDTIFDADVTTRVDVMPLGVEDPFVTRWVDHRVDGRVDERIRMLHVTTDTFWDGRKGTQELLRAWKIACDELRAKREATLTIHCLPQLYPTVYQEIGDLRLLDDVKVIAASRRGTTSHVLFELIYGYDLLVAPSRSEGFGIMPLSALVSGTPVLTTAGTGQDEYLDERRDGEPVLGGWLQVPTMGMGELAGEDGEAPLVRSDQLAFSLASAWNQHFRLTQSIKRNRVQAEWSWRTRRKAWVEAMIEWEEGR